MQSTPDLVLERKNVPNSQSVQTEPLTIRQLGGDRFHLDMGSVSWFSWLTALATKPSPKFCLWVVRCWPVCHYSEAGRDDDPRPLWGFVFEQASLKKITAILNNPWAAFWGKRLLPGIQFASRMEPPPSGDVECPLVHAIGGS